MAHLKIHCYNISPQPLLYWKTATLRRRKIQKLFYLAELNGGTRHTLSKLLLQRFYIAQDCRP